MMAFLLSILLLSLSTSSAHSFNVEKAIQYNEKESHKVYFDLPKGCVRDYEAEEWTGLTEEPQMRCISKGHGTAKVLLIGNSYGYRTFPVLHKLFNGHYAEFRLFTKSSRMFLNKDPLDSTRINYSKLAKRVLKKSRPDIVFVIEKDMAAAQNTEFSGAIEDDPVFNFTQTRINFLSEHVGNVVIDAQYYKPSLPSGIATLIVDRLKSGMTDISDFDDLRIEREEYLDEFKFGLRRLHALRGNTLVKNRVQDQLCRHDYCYFFNRKNLHSYYGDSALHQTTEMLKKLKPGYKRIVKHFLKEHKTGRHSGNALHTEKKY